MERGNRGEETQITSQKKFSRKITGVLNEKGNE